MATGPLNTVDWAKMVRLYIQARDKLDELKKQYEAACLPIQEAMDRMELMFLGNLNQQNVESIRTAAGTFFKQNKISVTVGSKPEFNEWLAADWTNRSGYADIRAAKANILIFKNESKDETHPNGLLPPGINYREEAAVHVRRDASA